MNDLAWLAAAAALFAVLAGLVRLCASLGERR